MPGPLSLTSTVRSSPAVDSATAMLVPGGVWARALASRFATAWRIRSSSPTRSEPPLELKLIGQSA